MKKIFLKLVILFMVFVATIGIYFAITIEKNELKEEVMPAATLPVVSIVYEDMDVNTLHGYTISMDGRYMRDSITPLTSQRMINLNIDMYDNVIAGISYELRSLDTERLVEKTSVTDFTVEGNTVNAEFKISGMIGDNEEYLLIIKLVTEKHGEINYYTRVIEQEQINVKEHIEFIEGFSESTLDEEKARDYLPYLEPKTTSDNSNLGSVNINSSFTSVTWGDLDVERVTEPIVAIKELLGDVGCYELNYKVRAKDSNNVYQYYNVSEYFRVRKGVNVMYLYVYERNMEQIFECGKNTVSATRINLGIDSDLGVETSSSPTGSFVSFVKERNLWLMDMNKNQMISVMSFESGSDSDVRDVFNENNIEIVSTGKDGNILFLVYGYMNKGDHEGEVGTALYQYEYNTNTVKEMVFVTSNKPYQILKGQVGKFAYITEDNIIYLMVEDNIYTITTDSNEYVQLANNLQNGNFIINGDNNIVAWHENGSIYGADSIRVIDVAASKDYKIEAPEGDFVKVIGFIGDDLVYGIANSEDIYEDELGNTVFPMYKMVVDIYDENEEDAVYEKDGIYIGDVSINNNMLMLKRMVKNENGKFVDTSDDQLINKVENNRATIELTTIATDLKKTELILKFAYTVTSDNSLAKVEPENIEFITSNDMGRSEEKMEDKNYYVYGNGKLLLTTKSIITAINEASRVYGVVVGGDGNYVWARLSKLDNKVVPSATDAASPDYSTITEVLNDENIEILDVSTISIEDVLYYTTKEMPVLVNLPERGVVAISGYSGYSGNVDTIYFRAYDGENFNMPIKNAENAIIEGGNRYIVVIN
ncbi:MAG: hypothetical protein IIX45_06565 [Lachnospiraceae bacterium]|nr:hypothetical protein [Lachnospiraceae bacterium]